MPQVLRWMPFLTQSPNLLGLGTATVCSPITANNRNLASFNVASKINTKIMLQKINTTAVTIITTFGFLFNQPVFPEITPGWVKEQPWFSG